MFEKLAKSRLAKEISKAQEALEPGEEIICAIAGNKVSKSTLPGVLLATEKRLIFYSNTLGISKTIESFNYEFISSIDYSTNYNKGASLSFYVSGNKISMNYIRSEDAKSFVAKVRPRIGKKNESSRSSNDITDQIKKLAELKDAGILTEEEFHSKKTELLSKI